MEKSLNKIKLKSLYVYKFFFLDYSFISIIMRVRFIILKKIHLVIIMHYHFLIV